MNYSFCQIHHSIQIIFFERNGLRYTEFSLPPAPHLSASACCTQLDYSADSELLGVLLTEPGCVGRTWMFIYTHSNGHHYLKWSSCLGACVWRPSDSLETIPLMLPMRLQFPDGHSAICSFRFDAESGDRVGLMCRDGTVRWLQLALHECVSGALFLFLARIRFFVLS